jgi:hypothetical protein
MRIFAVRHDRGTVLAYRRDVWPVRLMDIVSTLLITVTSLTDHETITSGTEGFHNGKWQVVRVDC